MRRSARGARGHAAGPGAGGGGAAGRPGMRAPARAGCAAGRRSHRARVAGPPRVLGARGLLGRCWGLALLTGAAVRDLRGGRINLMPPGLRERQFCPCWSHDASRGRLPYLARRLRGARGALLRHVRLTGGSRCERLARHVIIPPCLQQRGSHARRARPAPLAAARQRRARAQELSATLDAMREVLAALAAAPGRAAWPGAAAGAGAAGSSVAAAARWAGGWAAWALARADVAAVALSRRVLLDRLDLHGGCTAWVAFARRLSSQWQAFSGVCFAEWPRRLSARARTSSACATSLCAPGAVALRR